MVIIFLFFLEINARIDITGHAISDLHNKRKIYFRVMRKLY
jgi:hypothetical protein